MGTLTSIDPRWIKSDGTDIPAVAPADYATTAPRGDDREQSITAAVESGDWATVEAWDGVHSGTVHALLDPLRRGESVTYTTPAPSWYVATNSEKKVSRGKKGTSTTITYRGRVTVVGDSTAMDDQTTRSGRVPRVVISHAIDELRANNRYGHVDGDRLAALTTRLFDVPALIGSDQWSWSEATPEIPSSGAAVLAAQTCGLSGGAVPMLDAAVGPEYRCADTDPRWFPTSYARKSHLRSHSTRLRLPVPRRRLSDPLPREHVLRDALAWCHVIELPAPTADTGHVFHGHRVIARGETVKRARATSIRDAFVIAANADLPTALASLAAVVQDDGAGKYGWRVVDTDTAGTITVDKRGRLSVVGAGYVVRQCTTVHALRTRLATQ